MSSKFVKLIYLGVGCHGGGFFFSPYMSLFCAFGADCQCAAISSSTAAVGTSVDRANLKCGKIFSSLPGNGFYANPSFRRVLFLSSSSSSFYSSYLPMRGGWGGDYDSLKNVVFGSLEVTWGFTP